MAKKKTKKNLKKIKVGSIVGKTALHNRYWYGAAHELDRLEYVKQQPSGKKGEVTKYKVLKELPSKEEFEKEVREKIFTKGMSEVLQDAVGEIEEIKDKMEQWNDSMQENEGLSQTSKAEEVQNAYDELEYLDLSTLGAPPESLEGKDVILPTYMPTWFPHRSRRHLTGRNARLSDAGEALLAVAAVGQELLDKQNELEESGEASTDLLRR